MKLIMKYLLAASLCLPATYAIAAPELLSAQDFNNCAYAAHSMARLKRGRDFKNFTMDETFLKPKLTYKIFGIDTSGILNNTSEFPKYTQVGWFVFVAGRCIVDIE